MEDWGWGGFCRRYSGEQVLGGGHASDGHNLKETWEDRNNFRETPARDRELYQADSCNFSVFAAGRKKWQVSQS